MTQQTTAVATAQQQNGGMLISLNELERAADIVHKGGLFGMKSKEETATLMMVAQSEGSHIMTALREFHVIDGKPSLKAEAMLGRFQRSGGSVKWIERTDTKCEAEFSHPQGGKITVTWTIEQAEKAGYTTVAYKKWYEDKNGEKRYTLEKKPKDKWLQNPRQMLHARVVSEGVRSIYPACIQGFYTPEEVVDFTDKEAVEESKFKVDIDKAAKPAKTPPKPAPVKEAEVVQEPAKTAQNISAQEVANLRAWLSELNDFGRNLAKEFCTKNGIDLKKGQCTPKQASELESYILDFARENEQKEEAQGSLPYGMSEEVF